MRAVSSLNVEAISMFNSGASVQGTLDVVEKELEKEFPNLTITNIERVEPAKDIKIDILSVPSRGNTSMITKDYHNKVLSKTNEMVNASKTPSVFITKHQPTLQLNQEKSMLSKTTTAPKKATSSTPSIAQGGRVIKPSLPIKKAHISIVTRDPY